MKLNHTDFIKTFELRECSDIAVDPMNPMGISGMTIATPVVEWKGVSLDTAWKNLVEEMKDLYGLSTLLSFPIARQVSARTVGLDIVPVQPMAAPSGILNYIDFVYSPSSNEEDND